MGRILVSASHYDTLCREAWKIFEEHGHEVIFDPSRSFPAYSLEELIMRCDSDSGKKLIKSMVLRTADRQGMC